MDVAMHTGIHRRALLVWLREAGVLLLIYLASFAAMLWARQTPLADWLRVALTVAPIVPGLALVWSTVRSYRRCDEFVRQSILQAAALTALVTAVWTLAYTFLQPLGLPLLPVGMVHAIGWPVFIWQMVRVMRIRE